MPGVPATRIWAWGLGDNLIVVIPASTGDRTHRQRSGRSTRCRVAHRAHSDYAVLEPLLTPIVESVTDD
jgi:hypothetical protein